MRIGIIGSGSASLELPQHFYDGVSHQPGVAVELVNPRLSIFAFTAYERLLVDVGYVDAVQSAEAAGCDAVVINSFADYGIEAARAVAGIPIVGAGEAALLAAQAYGSSFCILTVWPESMRFLYDERLQRLGLTEQCSAILHFSAEEELGRLTDDSGVMSRMSRHDGETITLLREARDRLIARYAPASIVLGCTCMAPIGPALAVDSAVPVLESSRIALQQALDQLHRVNSAVPAAKTRRPELVPAMVSAWVDAPTASAPPATSDCPVCIVDVE